MCSTKERRDRERRQDRKERREDRHRRRRRESKEEPPPEKQEEEDVGDYFAEVIIDELKGENAELKAALSDREKQLKGAADKVTHSNRR